MHGGRVLACTTKIASKSFKDVVNVLKKFYVENLEISIVIDNFFKYINKIKKYYKEKYEASFTDNRQGNKRKLEYIDGKVVRIPVSKKLATLDNTNVLVESNFKIIIVFILPQGLILIRKGLK